MASDFDRMPGDRDRARRLDGASVTTPPMPDKARRHSGGRPSHDEAMRRNARLIEIAASMFMERGFEATSVDAVAEAAGIGKATLYARYKDKGELFAAVLQRKIDRWLAMNETDERAATGRIEDVLLARARRTVAVALTPEAVAINRIVMAESARFPTLAKLVHEQGWQRSNAAVAALLDQFVANGQIQVEDTNVAADLFLSLVIGRQTRLAMLGIETDPGQIDQRMKAAVNLFLNGVRPRPTK
jgi:TetR/AcrR family transcriptional regulator, mexJK operon transcriptional repressor